MRHVLSVVVLLLASRGLAYDSKCYLADGGACREGYESARERWVGPSDEHRQLLVEAVRVSGVPADLFTDAQLVMFTGDAGLPDGFSTVAPVPFSEATGVTVRTMSVPEFAQLPDFSYSLADWATGNETCPLDALLGQRIDPVACHTLFGHMGAANSNHFVPQSENMYRHYHGLALERARVCATMRARLSTRHAPFVKDCLRHALTLEAIGQHFLQDAWSTGHMWERWGSANPADAPSFVASVAVAAVTGVFHGTRGVMASIEEGLGTVANVVIDDALCAPHPEVAWRSPTSPTPQPGVGDIYASDLLSNSAFASQRTSLFSCAVSGLRAVAETGGETLPSPTVTLVDPTSPQCFDQRVTNLALWKGAGVDATIEGRKVFVPLTPELATSLLFGLRASGARPGPLAGVTAEELERLSRQVGFSLARIAAQLEFFAKNDPSQDSLARGTLHPLAGLEANSAYAFRTPPAPYADSADAGSAEFTQVARAFHRAYATEWCATMTQSDLEALRQHAMTVPDAGRAAACGACVEFVSRHARIGDGGVHDATREPLCHELGTNPAYVYDVASTNQAVAEQWCSCSTRCKGSFTDTPTLQLFGTNSVTLDQPGSRTFTGGLNNQGTGEGAVAWGEVSSSCSVNFAGQRHGGFGVSADWNDFVVVMPDDRSLIGQSAVLVGEVALTARGRTQAVSGREPFASSSFNSDLDTFQFETTGGAYGPVQQTRTMRWNVRLGASSRFRGALRSSCGFSGPINSAASGSSQASTSARWVRLVRIETASGTPIPATLCSLSGTVY